MSQDDAQLGNFDGEIVCETPNNLLNKFEGTSKIYVTEIHRLSSMDCVLEIMKVHQAPVKSYSPNKDSPL